MKELGWLLALVFLPSVMLSSQNFVTVEGSKFMLHGLPYHYVGANLWYGMHLGSEESGDRDRLKRELDQLKELGLCNLRIMASSEGPDSSPWRVSPTLQHNPGEYAEHLWQGLDFLLVEMAKRDMKAVVCLSNFWPWSGGMAQYVSWASGEKIPYPPPADKGSWTRYMLYTCRFYSDGQALNLYNAHVDKVVTRRNSISGVLYAEDPTIMSWQLANEPRGMVRRRAYRSWIKKTARLIKELDPNHLVSLGSEGETSSSWSGNRFLKDHDFKEIDYATAHIWIENWGWYDPLQKDSYTQGLARALDYLDRHHEMAQKLGKPLVLEEFGIARDDRSYQPDSETAARMQYFKDLDLHGFPLMQDGNLAGYNFWAWGGEGRPGAARQFWQIGHPLIGDPPHEHQGWYSIYDSEKGTLEVLKKWSRRVDGLLSPK